MPNNALSNIKPRWFFFRFEKLPNVPDSDMKFMIEPLMHYQYAFFLFCTYNHCSTLHKNPVKLNISTLIKEDM